MPDLTEFKEIKTKSLTLKVYSDPGHAWLAVPIRLLEKVNPRVSPYSYINNSRKVVFLEEDMDAEAFINKAKLMGIIVKVKFCTTNKTSKIRNYDRFSLNWSVEK